MKKYAPLATLVAVVLLGAGLLVANMLSNPANQTTAAPAPSAAAAAAPGEPAAAEPAPAEPPPAEPAVVEKAYTGRSAGNEVTVAIAVKNGKAVAYACDGKKIEAWLEGTLTGDSLSLSGKTSSITATLDDKASFGTVTVDGKEWPFSAKGVAVARRAVRGPRQRGRRRRAGRVDRAGGRHGDRRRERRRLPEACRCARPDESRRDHERRQPRHRDRARRRLDGGAAMSELRGIMSQRLREAPAERSEDER